MPFGGVRGSAPAKTTMAPANSLLLTRFKRIVKVEWGRGHIPSFAGHQLDVGLIPN